VEHGCVGGPQIAQRALDFRWGCAMNNSWFDIMFVPDENVAAATTAAWEWLVPGPWTIIACSMFGGIFLEKRAGGVYWLECGTALIERIGENASEFHAYLGGDRDPAWDSQIEEWFLTNLVARLHDAGKRPAPGQCYGLTVLPVFEGGRYEVDNIFVVSAVEWLTHTASIHNQLRDLPDGGQVAIKVVH